MHYYILQDLKMIEPVTNNNKIFKDAIKLTKMSFDFVLKKESNV